MHSTALVAASLLMLTCSQARALDMPKVPAVGGMSTGSMLDKINKSLADQQKKDGQFEFKTGKAEFASGNAKRISGLLEILTRNSKMLSSIPNLHVGAEGHTDADGTAESNQKLSVARAKTVCSALKAKGMKLPCTPTGAGSSKPLVSPEKSAADKQKNLPRAGTAREVVHTVHQLFSATLWPLFQNRSLSCTSKTFPAPT